MTKQVPCRDCSENIVVAPEKIEEMLQYLIKSGNRELADEETSNKRLSLCMGCTAYVHGGTCKYCGCLVQIRTKLQGQCCPYPLHPKW
jgi:hypothetical protein